MITYWLLLLITDLIGFVFQYLPIVTISSIPYIGSTVSTTLTTMVETWNAFMVTFPYAQFAWYIFIYAIIPTEILLLLGKFFLGHRMPAHMN